MVRARKGKEPTHKEIEHARLIQQLAFRPSENSKVLAATAAASLFHTKPKRSPDDEIGQLITASPNSPTEQSLNKKYPSLHMLKDMFKRVKKAKLSAERKVEELETEVEELKGRLSKVVLGEVTIDEMKRTMEKEGEYWY